MERIKKLQLDFESFLGCQCFNGFPSELYAPIDYTIRQEGKRLRPVLCLLACEMVSGSAEKALFPALSLETFHNFTLIHDDIMDKAPLRRGMATVYKKWNSNVAILSGDAMFAMALGFALDPSSGKPAETARLLVKVAREVCEGQQMDLNFESQQNISKEAYMEMIRLKTAVLLATSLQMGCLVGGADKDTEQKLYDFGIAIGLAFQLQDDLLDLYSDVEVFGKISGGDILEKKKTFLYLTALQYASQEQRVTLDRYYSDENLPGDVRIAGVKSIYDLLGVKAYVEKEIDGYLEQSLSLLDELNVAEGQKRSLRNFVAKLCDRKK